MRKSIIIVLAVAIIGAVGIYEATRGHTKTPAMTPTSSTSSVAAGSSTSDSLSNNSPTATPTSYKDGTFTGTAEDTPYGTVQVAAVVSGGKITDVKFLQMPQDQGRSTEITQFSEPQLKQSAISKQSAQIDFVSGATSTSMGYEQSLQKALDQAAQS